MKHTEQKENSFDVVIIGGGTGAMGAAYALKGLDYSVAVIEQESLLGGTACNSWVETWIEGLIPPHIETICRDLGVNVEKSWLRKEFAASKESCGFYLDRMKLSGKYKSDLEEAGVTLRTSYRFLSVSKSESDAQGKTVCKSILVRDLSGKVKEDIEISAQFFIDASADGVLCRELGVECYSGRDSSEMYGESIAPRDAEPYKKYLNEPSLFFKIEKGYDDSALLDACETVFAEYAADGKTIKQIHYEKAPYLSVDGYPCSHWVNPMSGTGAGTTGYQVLQTGTKESYEEFIKRTVEYWKFLKLSLKQAEQQGKSKLGAWNVSYASWGYKGEHASYLGVRETNRVRCEYMLRQDDLSKLLSSGSIGEHIASGSHSADFHVLTGLNTKELEALNKNQDNGMPELRPYGIPYKCLIPFSTGNVLVASRCFGASQVANASARVNIVMAQLGWAAGNALRFCLDKGFSDVSDVNEHISTLQSDQYTGFASRVKRLESKYNDVLHAEIKSR